MSSRQTRLTRAVMTAAALLALAGCTAPTPWVKPYEREHFADPIMSFNRDPISSTYLDHALETREGAHGGTGAVGGGCGCN
ncbi:MAG: DUF4266 domain-containing protein [Gammaproteobacteria bacterium]|nr:DUF4266 domain-containing protein [Gammaproteobacteria bacterium]MBV8405641.1 DUF4266 domain-containing protein [Gammaproteobacteria bacterium]